MIRNPFGDLARLCALLLGAACFLEANALQADHLFWHEVRLDKEEKILSWVEYEDP